jgi:hypothetical protein
MKTLCVNFALLFVAAFSLAAASACPQAEQQEVRHHGMMHASESGHPISDTARLTVSENPSAHELVLRIGPLNLPAHTGHDSLPQPPTMWLSIPFTGWLTAYHPSLIDSKGAALPNHLLHHAAFFNTARSDFLCPDKEEHIFGAGGEMNDWPAIPSVGYRVQKGDRIRITAMFENATAQDYREAFLQVRVDYQLSSQGAPLKDVYPAWFNVMECGESAYDLPAGISSKTGQFKLAYSGKLLAAGGHLHDYGDWLVLKNDTTDQTIAALESTLDPSGRIISMPIKIFADPGGIPLRRGDVVDVTDAYDNPTGKLIPNGAMGIVVGYFLPDDESQFSALGHPEDHP